MGAAVGVGAALSALSTAVGTGFSAVAQDQAMRSELGRLERNREFAQRQRNDVIQRGEYDAARVEQAGNRVAESARAALGASGVSTTAGTVPGLFDASRANAAADAARVRANARRAAWGFEVEREDMLQQKLDVVESTILGQAGNAIQGTLGLLGSIPVG